MAEKIRLKMKVHNTTYDVEATSNTDLVDDTTNVYKPTTEFVQEVRGYGFSINKDGCLCVTFTE